jgi:uncharacterized membrane protein YcfT
VKNNMTSGSLAEILAALMIILTASIFMADATENKKICRILKKVLLVLFVIGIILVSSEVLK